jgi:hypothetical protein
MEGWQRSTLRENSLSQKNNPESNPKKTESSSARLSTAQPAFSFSGKLATICYAALKAAPRRVGQTITWIYS